MNIPLNPAPAGASLEALHAGPPFLIGGAFAFETYTGIKRRTKDLDLFIRPGDRDAALAVLASAGYRTEGVQLQASRLAPLPDGTHRLAATNPVYLVCGVLP